jgi:hypothetical protein
LDELAWLDKSKRVPLPKQERIYTQEEIAEKYANVKESHFALAQRDRSKAEMRVTTLVGVPGSRQDLRNFVHDVRNRVIEKRRTSKEREDRISDVTASWSMFQQYKEVETKLFMYDSVTALRYTVKEGDPIDMGIFHVKVKDQEDIIPVTRAWVMANFEPAVVRSVIQNSLGTFVDIEASQLQIFVDKRQVQRVQFIPIGRIESSVVKLSEPAEPNNYNGTFVGVLTDGRCIKLTTEYVAENFPPAFLNQVVQHSLMNKPKFFNVPPGAPRTMGDHKMLNPNYPKVAYMQLGRGTCLFSSFASALHYVGLHEPAKEVAEQAVIWSTDETIFNWQGLLQLVQSSCHWLVPRRLHKASFDILKDQSEYPTVLQLQATDGGTQHAVTVVGGLVFDSNCERALPLSLKTLDYCCSTDDKDGNYHGIYHGYRFSEIITKNGSKWEKLKKKFNTNFFLEDYMDTSED